MRFFSTQPRTGPSSPDVMRLHHQFLILAVSSSFCLSEGHLRSWGDTSPSYLTDLLWGLVREWLLRTLNMQNPVINSVSDCKCKQSLIEAIPSLTKICWLPILFLPSVSFASKFFKIQNRLLRYFPFVLQRCSVQIIDIFHTK